MNQWIDQRTDQPTKRGVESHSTQLKTVVTYEVIHSKINSHSAMDAEEQTLFFGLITMVDETAGHS